MRDAYFLLHEEQRGEKPAQALFETESKGEVMTEPDTCKWCGRPTLRLGGFCSDQCQAHKDRCAERRFDLFLKVSGGLFWVVLVLYLMKRIGMI